MLNRRLAHRPGSPEEFADATKRHADTLVRIVKDKLGREGRLRYD